MIVFITYPNLLYIIHVPRLQLAAACSSLRSFIYLAQLQMRCPLISQLQLHLTSSQQLQVQLQMMGFSQAQLQVQLQMIGFRPAQLQAQVKQRHIRLPRLQA